MRAALTVARELLRCRLMESGRDALLERVSELLDAAATGAPPFCYRLPSGHFKVARRASPHLRAINYARGLHQHQHGRRRRGLRPPHAALDRHERKRHPHGPGRMPYYHPQDAIMGGATWSMGHHGEVFGVTAPEAYVPRMMDQEYTPEDDPCNTLRIMLQ